MDIQTLDTLFLGQEGSIGVFVIETDEGPALFDTGPASALDGLIRSLEKAGISPKDVRHVFVTHIHLDHAGAAWWFARQGAKVYAHVKAVPHLADPFRLWSSVKRLYGSMAETLWGEIHPVPYSNLRVLGDKERISLGDVNIIALDTPGHAIHHLAYMVDGAVICGDIGGVRFNKGPAIPPCPPPDINIKDWIHSIERLSALRLSKLFLTHFGPFDDVQEHLAALKGRLISYTRFIREGMKGGLTQQELIDRFEEFFREEFKSLHLNEEMLAIYELTNPPWTNVLGLVRYLQKKKEAL